MYKYKYVQVQAGCGHSTFTSQWKEKKPASNELFVFSACNNYTGNYLLRT